MIRATKADAGEGFCSAATGLPDDSAIYDDELALLAKKGEDKWFSAPWLYAECVRPSSPNSLYARERGRNRTTEAFCGGIVPVPPPARSVCRDEALATV